MKKNLKIFLISISFLLFAFFATSNTQASVNNSQAVVRFYQEKAPEEERPATSSNTQKDLPQTGSSISNLGSVGFFLLLIVGWLKRHPLKK